MSVNSNVPDCTWLAKEIEIVTAHGWKRQQTSVSNASTESPTDETRKAWSSRNWSTRGLMAPSELHDCFLPHEVEEEPCGRYVYRKKLQDATRNKGQVFLAEDLANGSFVAVKRMPTKWVCLSHQDFLQTNPTENEFPWRDIGCRRFLQTIGYPYHCEFHGVHRDDQFTCVVSEVATEGDLFAWCTSLQVDNNEECNFERERVFRPLARQILRAVQQLHELSITHKDLSLENILVTKSNDDSVSIKVIDFGMSSTQRCHKDSQGKPSYSAPEVYIGEGYDGFLSDAFAVGVLFYAAMFRDYPWLSTKPGHCKCFSYVQRHGFRAYFAKRRLRETGRSIQDSASEHFLELLEGLLEFEPALRLTLGEPVFESRKSVWVEPWVEYSTA